MDGAEVTEGEVYRCASCGRTFSSEKKTSQCPFCRGRFLVHLEGEPRRAKGCVRSCSGCSGCGGPER